MIGLPTSTIAGIEVPQSDLISKAVAYINKHNDPWVIHHSIRSAIWCLIIQSKLPLFTDVTPESIVVSTLLHDIGWSKSSGLTSPDKRFEIDGANVAKEFIAAEAGAAHSTWNASLLQDLWDSIALHSTPSIALHGRPIVRLACWGITADFAGPFTPGNVITIDEYKTVLKAYPRIGFARELKDTICGLCRSKPETTYDNFAADFGREYIEGYAEKCAERSVMRVFEGYQERLKHYDDYINENS